MICCGVVRPVQNSSTNASVVQPTAAGSITAVKPLITPLDRSRSTRRLTAGADSDTLAPISAYDARASATQQRNDSLVDRVDLQRFAPQRARFLRCFVQHSVPTL